jgi:UDP:flavonoid glycosyltransferase YjiC (YdhE family)
MRLGFISMPVAGHLNPMTALARRLKSRGHEIVFIGVPDSAPKLPSQFHYAGPFHDSLGREPIDFPYQRLTRKPLIYASMGTLLNGMQQVYREILESIRQCPDLQAVVSIGRNIRREDIEPIPENAIVVPRAPSSNCYVARLSVSRTQD